MELVTLANYLLAISLEWIALVMIFFACKSEVTPPSITHATSPDASTLKWQFLRSFITRPSAPPTASKVLSLLFTVLIIALFVLIGLLFFLAPLAPNKKVAPIVVLYICCPIALLSAVVITIAVPVFFPATDSLVLIDQGKLEHMQMKLLDIMESCRESIVVLNSDWLVIAANPATLSSFRSLDMINSSFLLLVHPDDRMSLTNAVRELCKAQRRGGAPCDNFSSAFDSSMSLSDGQNLGNHTHQGLSLSARNVKHISVEYRIHDSRKKGWAWIESTFIVRYDDTPLKKKDGTTGSQLCPDSWWARLSKRSAYIDHFVADETRDMNDGASCGYTITLLSRNVNTKKREEQIRVEEEKQRAKEKENQAKLNYITCCAHDLKTPLQSFKFAIELLERSNLRPDQAEIVEQARVSAAIMSMTISQTMDTSKVLMGQHLIPRKATVELSEVISHVAMVIDTYCRQTPITFHLANCIFNRVITCEEWLWQMLLNYLTNACKFTETGSIDVHVQLWSQAINKDRLIPAVNAEYESSKEQKTDRLVTAASTASTIVTSCYLSDSSIIDTKHDYSTPTDFLLFQIADTGVGVSSEHTTDLFDLYSQAQVGQAIGTGIGLYGVKIRSEGLGGSCGMYDRHKFNSSEHGSVFWFKIPFVPDRSSYSSSSPNSLLADASHYDHFSYLVCEDSDAEELLLELPLHTSTKGNRCPVSPKQRSSGRKAVAVAGSEASSLGAMNPLPLSAVGQSERRGSIGICGGTDEFKDLQLTAFVVDDVRSIRKLMQRSLQQLGFLRIELYENGSSVLRALKEEHVDVVFMDIQMPVMSGPEAVSRMRKFEEESGRSERQLIVAVSANFSQKDEQEMVGLTMFDAVIPKPIGIADIKRVVNEYSSGKLPLRKKLECE